MTRKMTKKEAESQDMTIEAISEDKPELAEFLKARKKAKAGMDDKHDVNFWVCLVFQSYEQKMEFLEQLKEVHTLYNMYVDGETFAKSVGIPITPNSNPVINTEFSKKLAALVDKNTLDKFS